MTTIETSFFGTLTYQEEDLIRFPQGLPGFEEETAFLAIERDQTKPVIFLQSIHRPELFFVTLPVDSVDPQYELALLDEHRHILSNPTAADLICLALVCLPDEGSPTANLLGPIVIHRPTRLSFTARRMWLSRRSVTTLAIQRVIRWGPEHVGHPAESDGKFLRW